MITYKTILGPLDCIPSDSGLSDIVKTIHWRIEASELKNWEDPDLGKYYAVIGGSTQIDPVSPSGTFIPFESLNTGVIYNWLEAKINISGVDGIYSGLSAQIEKQKNPSLIRKQIGATGYEAIS
jgi:hypothetical protein